MIQPRHNKTFKPVPSNNLERCRLGGGTEPNILKTLLGSAIAPPNLPFS
ncbi:hypothetical protein [Anabaena sp. CCY 9910]